MASTIQRKLAINQADINVLSAHPYLSKKEAQILLNYRTQHGNFKSIDDVRKVKILSEDTLKKLAPYLVFD
ncbi:MAG: helix-hairpin-helix domain-containing protein [Saprospiraceae bacterium]|nr:helix-hairpin-helix domain-containing protein [Saprospiraceae bacterium]